MVYTRLLTSSVSKRTNRDGKTINLARLIYLKHHVRNSIKSLNCFVFLPKTDVHLHLDEQIWQLTQAAVQQAGLELPEYVERALERLKDN